MIKDEINYYVFLDEVQMVKDFQKVVDSLYIKKNVDVYITGSNSTLLSGELATLLSGRYIKIEMLPLSFKEYVSASDNTNYQNLFLEYSLSVDHQLFQCGLKPVDRKRIHIKFFL